MVSASVPLRCSINMNLLRMFICSIRNLTYKFIFDRDRSRAREEREFSERIKHFKMAEFRALRDLILLLEENDSGEPSGENASNLTIPPKKFKLKSKNFPDLMTSPKAWAFLCNIIRDKKLLKTPFKHDSLTL